MSTNQCAICCAIGKLFLWSGLVLLPVGMFGLAIGMVMMLSGAAMGVLGLPVLAFVGPWTVLVSGGMTFFALLFLIIGFVSSCTCGGGSFVNPFTLAGAIAKIAALLPLVHAVLTGLKAARDGLQAAADAAGFVNGNVVTAIGKVNEATNALGALSVPSVNLPNNSLWKFIGGDADLPGPPWVLSGTTLGATPIFGGVQTTLLLATGELTTAAGNVATVSAQLQSAAGGLTTLIDALEGIAP